MDTREKDIEKLKDYKYGFTTDIENIKAPKGLNEDVIKFISNIKKEPQWMLDFRLNAYERLKLLKEPNWQKPKYPKIDYQDLYYYSAPQSHNLFHAMHTLHVDCKSTEVRYTK